MIVTSLVRINTDQKEKGTVRGTLGEALSHTAV